jgi:hypothetical protein
MIPVIDEALFHEPVKPEAPKVLSYFVRCEICKEIIAELDIANTHLPIKGSMFLSADPHHGRPAPFYSDHDWLLIRCPICHYRPFLSEDSVELADGTRYQIPVCKESFTTDKLRDSAVVARVAHAHKVEGSNPSPATNKPQEKRNHHKKGGNKK